MQKLKIARLERDEDLRELLYHIKGIVEAAENVADLTAQLNDTYRRDAETYAKTSSLLEVEALEHLGYHVKQLRKPLRRLERSAYGSSDTKKRPARPRRVTAVAKRAKR